jgi:hypothetical protein
MVQDLLSKLQTQISFAVRFGLSSHHSLEEVHSVKTALKGPEMPFEVPGIWAEDNPPGLAVNIPPVVIEIKPGVTPVRMRQYPIPMKAREGISHHLQRLLNYEILRSCQSAWNTPLLPVHWCQAPMTTTQCTISEPSFKQQ